MNFKDRTLFEPQKLHRTPEGYLTAFIRCTCAGVFRYVGKDGKTIDRVLRPENEVGDPASVASANSKPVTLKHPNEMVDVENIKKYEVGFTGTDAYFDGIDLWITITITDPKAIEAIEKKEVQAVSMGYDVQVLEENNDPLNNWRGTEYSFVQHGIRYNHLALVYAGRAGESVEIAVGDSIEEIVKPQTAGKHPAKETTMAKKNLLIDGAVYECDEAVAERIAGLEKKLNDSAVASKSALDAVTAERDSAKAELEKTTAERDAAQAEVKTLKEKQLDESEIARRVDEKIALVEKAKGFGCEVKAEDSALDIKKAVIAKAFGDKMDLNEKTDAYVEAAFDSACVSLGNAGGTPAADQSPLAPHFAGVTETSSYDTEDAYKAMKDKLAGQAAKKEA